MEPLALNLRLWTENRLIFEMYLRNTPQQEYATSYKVFYSKIIQNVLNTTSSINYYRPNLGGLETIKLGDSKGFMIISYRDLEKSQSRRDEFYYTTINYGDCVGCDPLMAIYGGDILDNMGQEDLPTEKQILMYMDLAWDMIAAVKRYDVAAPVGSVFDCICK